MLPLINCSEKLGYKLVYSLLIIVLISTESVETKYLLPSLMSSPVLSSVKHLESSTRSLKYFQNCIFFAELKKVLSV